MIDIVEDLRVTADDTDAVDNSSVAYLLEEAAAAIEKLRAERRWIPVSERRPESGETVLVWHYGDVQMAWFNHFTNGVAYFVRDTHYNLQPTHWLPLPGPPEEAT